MEKFEMLQKELNEVLKKIKDNDLDTNEFFKIYNPKDTICVMEKNLNSHYLGQDKFTHKQKVHILEKLDKDIYDIIINNIRNYGKDFLLLWYDIVQKSGYYSHGIEIPHEFESIPLGYDDIVTYPNGHEFVKDMKIKILNDNSIIIEIAEGYIKFKTMLLEEYNNFERMEADTIISE